MQNNEIHLTFNLSVALKPFISVHQSHMERQRNRLTSYFFSSTCCFLFPQKHSYLAICLELQKMTVKPIFDKEMNIESDQPFAGMMWQMNIHLFVLPFVFTVQTLICLLSAGSVSLLQRSRSCFYSPAPEAAVILYMYCPLSVCLRWFPILVLLSHPWIWNQTIHHSNWGICTTLTHAHVSAVHH